MKNRVEKQDEREAPFQHLAKGCLGDAPCVAGISRHKTFADLICLHSNALLNLLDLVVAQHIPAKENGLGSISKSAIERIYCIIIYISYIVIHIFDHQIRIHSI